MLYSIGKKNFDVAASKKGNLTLASRKTDTCGYDLAEIEIMHLNLAIPRLLTKVICMSFLVLQSVPRDEFLMCFMRLKPMECQIFMSPLQPRVASLTKIIN